MRRASIFHQGRSVLDLKMTSLIDVVFLLLIFFLWTASFQMVEHVLPSHVSQAGNSTTGSDSSQPPPPEADFADVVVRVLWIDGRPAWRVNESPLAALSEVQARLALVFAVNRDAPVVIHPDGEVPLGHVIDLYDAARIAGFAKVQFATSANAPHASEAPPARGRG
jgi:biopolymer transport protein ExbD